MSFIFSSTDLGRFEVRLELSARMPASPLVLPSLTPRRHRQAESQPASLCPSSPSFSSFGAACVKLCCLPPPSLVRNTRLCCLVYVWNVGDIMVVLAWAWSLNRVLYLRTQWMRSQRRSQFEHDHRRRADRAPQITASVTRDWRRTHWLIQWGKLGPYRIGAEMVARAACACILLVLSHRFVRSPMTPFPPEVNSFQFFYYCMAFCIVYNIQL